MITLLGLLNMHPNAHALNHICAVCVHMYTLCVDVHVYANVCICVRV